MILEYNSNNSGGYWWLTDDDWRAMEANGWHVNWVKDNIDSMFRSMVTADGRWLGTLATSATRVVANEHDAQQAIREWEELVSQSQDAEGCSCCGRPHHFWTYEEGA